MIKYRIIAVLKWLGKTALGAVLMTSISLLTTWYMVNAFMDKALEKINLTALDENLKFSDVWGKVSKDLNIVLAGGRSKGRE